LISPTFDAHLLTRKLCCVQFVYPQQWKGSNRKQGTRWQHISWLKASAFCIWYNKLWWFKTQQLILGTGTAIWWVTEPQCAETFGFKICHDFELF